MVKRSNSTANASTSGALFVTNVVFRIVSSSSTSGKLSELSSSSRAHRTVVQVSFMRLQSRFLGGGRGRLFFQQHAWSPFSRAFCTLCGTTGQFGV